jgi:transglutaminase/protease-like cytokinesis protein 3
MVKLALLLFAFTLSLHAQQSDFDGINFWKSEHIAKQYKGAELYNLPKLAYDLTSKLNTEGERFRAIYYWVCHNIRSEFNLMYKNERTRNKLKNDPEALHLWNNQFKKEVFTRLLQKKETLCTGYAYLIKELSELAGLECKIIYGYGEENKAKFENIDAPNHSWNVVKLNGKWYLCDATWSTGFIDMSTFLFEFNYDDTYFLMEPSEFVKSHRPIDEKWKLVIHNSEVIPSNK